VNFWSFTRYPHHWDILRRKRNRGPPLLGRKAFHWLDETCDPTVSSQTMSAVAPGKRPGRLGNGRLTLDASAVTAVWKTTQKESCGSSIGGMNRHTSAKRAIENRWKSEAMARIQRTSGPRPTPANCGSFTKDRIENWLCRFVRGRFRGCYETRELTSPRTNHRG
jgi:hypothetical protein